MSIRAAFLLLFSCVLFIAVGVDIARSQMNAPLYGGIHGDQLDISARVVGGGNGTITCTWDAVPPTCDTTSAVPSIGGTNNWRGANDFAEASLVQFGVTYFLRRPEPQCRGNPVFNEPCFPNGREAVWLDLDGKLKIKHANGSIGVFTEE